MITTLGWKRCWLLVSLAVVGCARRGGDSQVESRQAALDFPGGSITGTVTWNGTAVTGLGADHVYVKTAAEAFVALDGSGGYSFGSVGVGPQALRFDSGICGVTGPSVGALTVNVTAGGVANGDLDITATAGKVVGTITLGGAPVTEARVFLEGGCSGLSTDGNGAFAAYLPPGTYTASVSGATVLGSLTFEVTAGATTDLGAVDVAAGLISGTVTWNGTAVTGLGADHVYVKTAAEAFVALDGSGGYSFGSVGVGPQALRFDSGICGVTGPSVGARTVNVTAGGVANGDLDITATAGKVVGTITLGGAPATEARVFLEGGCSGLSTDGNGAFAAYLPPGTYTASVSGATVLGSLTFEVTVGATTDLGAVDVAAGSISGTVTWNGTAVTGLGADHVYVKTAAEAFVALDGSGGYSFGSVGVGPQGLRFDSGICGVTGPSVGARTVNVTAGVVANGDLDITATAGKVVGTITLGGAPATEARVFLEGGCSGLSTDGNGAFAAYLPPGTYTATVSGATVLGTFSFAIVAGSTTDIDSAYTGPAGGPAEVELLGGKAVVNGVTLNFMNVTADGDTMVVQSLKCGEDCSELPPGLKVVGTRYWHITSTALFDLSIGVCIHYDENEVQDLDHESELEFVHDDGSRWLNIRTSIDTDANVICGLTRSFSPFAIVEPDPGSNTPPSVTVPANVVAEATGAGGANVSFAASAADAEDVSVAPVCVPASSAMFPVGTTPVTCTATDSGGLSAAASFAVTVRDTTGPALVGTPADKVAYATSTAGAKVTFATPTASDAVDGALQVKCLPKSGSTFPVGKTTVTCGVADGAGNPASAKFTVWVQYQAPADGTFFLRPVRANGSSVFRIGRAVPVKFKLTGASAGITNLAAKLVVTKLSSAIQGTAEDVGDEDGEDTDLTFKYRRATGLYAYRWGTRGETQGTYRLRAELGDGVTHQVVVSLRGAK